MSLGLVVSCDVSDRYGTCGQYLPTGSGTEAEAYETARRAGWDAGRGVDRCPGHAPRRAGPPCGNNPRARLTPSDQQAVADFKAYLQRRAGRDCTPTEETPKP